MDSPIRPWWGTAAADTQCEGAAPRSDWAGWEAEGRAPASRDGNGFRTRYADDFALLAAHGITHHRLTVEWARLEPWPDRWDEDEAAHLRRVLTAAAEAGVAVWACLLHGSAPGWFTDDQRGWLDDKAATLTWPRHVDRVAVALGDLVAGWVPVHEPDLTARLGYGDGTFPPGRHREDDHHDARAALRTAEAEAARLLRSGPAPVAVAWRPGDPHEHDDLLVVSAPVDGLARPLDRVADEVGHAGVLVVTGDPGAGTGAGDGGGGPDGAATGDDDTRRERLAGAVREVAGAQDGGLAVVGAFHQPAIDGYEWHRGFAARLGLFDRDRNPRAALDALPAASAPDAG
ncbi:MAG TPA: family 1 glycosylhydrolase [Acidimicrobiales bacterium]|nr:family 1 glycosylhydrolase [Acidimicrobiales bacterium]